MLTTTSPRIVEEKHVPTPPTPQTASEPEPVREEDVLHWRITGRRWVTETITVDGATVIDALATIDGQFPGLQITDVHLLDS